MSKGRLILVPSALSVAKPASYVPSASTNLIFETRFFIAERAKTARHFLKSIGYPIPFAEVAVSELNKHAYDNLPELLKPCLDGYDCGLISEAGVPGVADPGESVVAMAHQLGIEVLPLVGPSSLLLALMSCGFNGQRFEFHGYLAKDGSELSRQLKQLEQESMQKNVTQMFIETPFRNLKMMSALLETLNPKTQVCVASNLTAPDQSIISKTILDWKKVKISFDRKPAVYLIYSGEKRQ
jgi:16S rRNA (cytidine1402-2'-O)-methyltransferase